jgi:hypothetical protein
MKLTHRFAEMTPDKRPQDPHMDGTGLRFEPWRTAANIPTPCRYVPITQNGKVVDS